MCSIPSMHNSYEIEISYGMITDPKFASSMANYGSRFAIITDDKVAVLHGEKLKKHLTSQGLETYVFSFPNGEKFKTRQTKERIEDQMLEQGLGRDTCIIAMGGGIATDLGGYVASTYCRGIPLIMIPTSLLGMIDASIGGKTGVNVPQGKNLIGCIYQPKKVCIDLSLLSTLPANELKNGSVEMIKHGLIACESYFEYLEKHLDGFFDLESCILEKAIAESCRIKQSIIQEDEKENGKRHLLNFGHTIGHAIENLTDYSISHGQAVALGLIVESYLAMQLGFLEKNCFERIHRIFDIHKIPYKLFSKLAPEKMIHAMAWDKKSLKGKPRFVILQNIGLPLNCESSYCTHVDDLELINVLNWMNYALCLH